MFNVEDEGTEKWLWMHEKNLRHHVETLRGFMNFQGQQVLADELEKNADVLRGWRDPQVMRERAQEIETKAWHELLAAEEKNMEALRKDDVHEIARTAHRRRMAKEKHDRAIAALSRFQGVPLTGDDDD